MYKWKKSHMVCWSGYWGRNFGLVNDVLNTSLAFDIVGSDVQAPMPPAAVGFQVSR